MKEVTLQVPDGKKVEWREVNGVTVPVLIDEQKQDNRPVTERIKTFEDALDKLGDDNFLVKEYWKVVNVDIELSADIIAVLKLRIIAAALNEGWEPKFTTDEYRYYPWFTLYTQEEIDAMDEEEKSRVVGRSNYNSYAYAGVAFSLAGSASSVSVTIYGGRLCFKTRALAEYAGEQFLQEWADFMLWQEK